MTDPASSSQDEWRFDGLRALYINCTLKRSPEPSHTQGLIDLSRSIMERHGVAGCLLTGNEDGVKHGAMNLLSSLQHLSYTIPPQADAGWIGEAGPGPSYPTPAPAGPRTTSTTPNTADRPRARLS
jgi:hypothetical protein